MKLTPAQHIAVMELIRQGYQVGQEVHPYEVFPTRNNVANANRRALYRVGAMFGCPRPQDWSSDFILTQAVLDAVQVPA